MATKKQTVSKVVKPVKAKKNPLHTLVGDQQYGKLAAKLGVTRSHVCRIMNGSREPSLGIAVRMASSLGVSLDKLVVLLSKRE